MELFAQADKVVRRLVPVILHAAGDDNRASVLRNLFPIEDEETAQTACNFLSSLEFWHERSEWMRLVRDFTFWAEAAVWAAARQDPESFKEYVERATDILTLNLPEVYESILN